MDRHVQTPSLPSKNGNIFACGEKKLSDDAHNIYYQKWEWTDMYKHLTFLPKMAMCLHVGKKSFLMMPISYITKNGNGHTCTSTLLPETCGKTELCDDTHIIYYQNGSGCTCTNTLPSFPKWQWTDIYKYLPLLPEIAMCHHHV